MCSFYDWVIFYCIYGTPEIKLIESKFAKELNSEPNLYDLLKYLPDLFVFHNPPIQINLTYYFGPANSFPVVM